MADVRMVYAIKRSTTVAILSKFPSKPGQEVGARGAHRCRPFSRFFMRYCNMLAAMTMSTAAPDVSNAEMSHA